jgi:hypothetical protein
MHGHEDEKEVINNAHVLRRTSERTGSRNISPHWSFVLQLPPNHPALPFYHACGSIHGTIDEAET